MSKRIADKGSSEAFLRSSLDAKTDQCIPWPFCTNDKGYGLAVIDGTQKAASRWMCILAHGEPVHPRTYAAHNCGNPACINPRHLRWATHKENMDDKVIHGTLNVGERNGKTTITEQDVRDIRNAPPHLKPLMERYGLSKHSISKIRSGARWGHVK